MASYVELTLPTYFTVYMKQRFSYLDLRLITKEVENDLKDAYLQNIYSLENSRRHFLLKFDAPPNETGKRYLIVDPGMRCHLTKYQHEPTPQPSYFVQKLRKYLRNRRATDFWVQPGSRLMVITFNGGQYYLVFEFFSGGNIILLDESHKILTLHRVVRDVGPSHQNHQMGEQYPLVIDKSSDGLQNEPNVGDLKQWVANEKLGKALYSKISDPSSSMIEYYLREQGLDPKKKLESEEAIDRVQLAVNQSLDHAHKLMTSSEPVHGYILRDEKENALEFEPFAEYFHLVHPNFKAEEHPTYNATVDHYFGALLSDKGVNKVEQLHELAESRLQAARNERQKRVGGLMQQQEINAELGSAIQEHADAVDAAIAAVKSLVDQGVDWGDAASLIQLEKEKGNRIAEIIASLDLEKQKVVVKLNDKKIPVHIDRSAHANARDYFELRKLAGAKIEKTEQHADKALKSAEIKIKRDLEANLAKHHQANNASKLHSIRQTHWFEKFWWFMTSTKHLVIAAREHMQSDLLLRRYFQEGDVALTSDAPDATLLIIKNPNRLEIAPQTLLQAGAFAVATSTKIWEAKSKAPSWFLTREQVPKVNSQGDPISMTDFRNIKGRSVVPPTPLDMGLALLWQIEVPEEEEPEVGDSEHSEEDFPDTQVDSDEDFPDTNLDSDLGASDDDNSDDDEEDDNDSVEEKAEAPEVFVNEESAAKTGAAEAVPSTEEVSESSEGEAETDEEEAPPSPSANAPEANAPKKVRGGKKKLRKYMAQDDEDRQAAMERLGTLKGLERKAAEKEAIEQARQQQKEKEDERKQRRRKAELALITDLGGEPEKQPFPTDLINKYSEDEPVIACVPMFAPWSSIQQAQYKAKLVFGSVKKGKASSELLRIILNTSVKPASDREKLLVEAVKPVDVQQSIAVSRVQIATATTVKNAKGGSGGKQTNKKQAKPSKKKK